MIKKKTHLEIKEEKPSVSDVKEMKRTPVFIVLDNIRSLQNVGAIFRTADGILSQELILCGITGHPPRKEFDKVALGACEVVPWRYFKSTVEALEFLKKNFGVKIGVLELTHESVNYRKKKYNFPLALVVGNEVDGVSDEVMEMADFAVDIPMLGRANSLNVATSLGIVAYEILGQYKDNY